MKGIMGQYILYYATIGILLGQASQIISYNICYLIG